MDDIQLLETAGATFREHIADLGDDQHFLPTPCGEWNVSQVISHVLGGNHMTVRLLEGAQSSEAIGYLTGLALGDDPLATFDANAAEQLAAFSEPGALEKVVEHPVGDMPGSVVIKLRIADMTIHSWDLARALGGDEELPGELVEAVWAHISPLADTVTRTGLFGDGPSGEVPDDAPLQVRLLDVTGRRP